MAFTITINTPPATPVLDRVTVNPGGGTIAPGNYRFLLFTSNTGYGQPPIYRSAPSNIIDVSILTNSSVTFEYTRNYPSSIYSFIMFSKNNEVWKEVVYYGTTNASTYTATSVVTSLWSQTPLAMDYYNNKIFGLSNTRGCSQISVSGSGDFTIADINNALLDSSLVQGEDYIYGGKNSLIGNYSIDARNYGSGTLDITGSTIYLAGGFINYPGYLTISTTKSGWATNKTHWFHNGFGTYQQTFANITNASLNNVSFNTCQLDASISAGNISRFYIYGGELNNCYLENIRMVTGFNYIKNSTIYLGDNYDIPDGTTDMTFYTVYFGITDKNKTHRRLKLYRREPFYYLFLAWANGSYIHKLIDCEFYSENDTLTKFTPIQCFGPEPNLTYEYAGGDTANNELQIIYTVNINIQDINNQYLSDAKITCYDSSNNELFIDYTDSSGNISQEIMVYKTHSYPGSIWIRTNYNPLTFKIEKENYQTSYLTNLNIWEPTNLYATMLNTVPPVYYNQQIDGSINQSSLAGTINTYALIGTIRQEVLQGSVVSTNLSGDIY